MLRETRVTPSGRTVVAKQAQTPEEASRLRREAALLEAARHPGVVEVLSLDGDPSRPVLLTAFVGGPTLAAAGPLSAQEAAGVVTAVAATLADLHHLGVVHGGVTADSVILGPDGSPVLCGFGHGGRVGEQPAHTDEPYDGAMDVFDLGVLARSLCPPRSAEARAFRRLVDDALAAHPADRPTARALADSIPATVAGARLPGPRAAGRRLPTDPEPEASDPLDALRRGRGPARAAGPAHRLPPGAVGVAVAAAVVVVVVLAAGSLRGGSPAAAPPSPDRAVDLPGPPPTPAAPSTSAAPSRPAAPSTSATDGRPPERAPAPAAPPDCPALAPGLAADVDGDGCADPLRYGGGILESGAARWSVGQAGDLVATGDWSCTGLRTLALLRPSTGELFRFDRWPASGADATVPSFARVTGGTALRAADLDQDGCHELVVEREGGAAEVVRPPRGAR